MPRLLVVLAVSGVSGCATLAEHPRVWSGGTSPGGTLAREVGGGGGAWRVQFADTGPGRLVAQTLVRTRCVHGVEDLSERELPESVELVFTPWGFFPVSTREGAVDERFERELAFRCRPPEVRPATLPL